MENNLKSFKKFIKKINIEYGYSLKNKSILISCLISNCRRRFKDKRALEVIELLKYKKNIVNDSIVGTAFLFIDSKVKINYSQSFEHGVVNGIINTKNSIKINNLFDLGRVFGTFLKKGTDEITLKNIFNNFNTKGPNISKFSLLLFSFSKTMEFDTFLTKFLSDPSLKLKISAMISLGIKNYNSFNKNIFEILLSVSKKTGPVVLEKNADFYNKNTRFIASICCGLVGTKKVLKSSNLLSELIINGMNQHKILRNCNSESLDIEIFYSELFKITDDFSTVLDEIFIEKLTIFPKIITSEDICRKAALAFYFGLKALKDGVDQKIYLKFLDFVLKIEEKAFENRKFNVLFLYLVISLSIIKNSSFDLEVIRLLRRLCLKNTKQNFAKFYKTFDFKNRSFKTFTTFENSEIELFKFCLGIVCAGFGLYSLKFDFKMLIAIFPFNLENIEYFKYFSLNLLVKNNTKFSFKNKIKKIVMDLYRKEVKSMADVDLKVFVDILSDYHENYSKLTVFSKKELFNLLSNIK